MKFFFVFIFFLSCISASSQQVTCKVADANTGAALPYATVVFERTNQFLYTDSSGEFSFSRTPEMNSDSVTVQYLSYTTAKLPQRMLTDGFVIKLVPQVNQLQNITVTACNKWKTVTVNKIPGRAKDYIGPGPETRMIIITRFTNDKNLTGYVKELEFYSGNFTERAQVPVRIHWYKWDVSTNMPGEELTTTNLIVYPYRKGWNKFSVPERTMYYPNDGVVLGLEFIYPVEYKKQYASFSNDKQKMAWLNDMNHRWNLGMQTTRDANDGCFFIANNEAVAAYSKKSDYRYLKPAVRVSIETCNQ